MRKNGAVAQTYFDYNTGSLANADLTDTQKALTAEHKAVVKQLLKYGDSAAAYFAR